MSRYYRSLIQTATPLLLDLYPGAAAAYSLRKLRNGYTGAAIRVRRSSDNTEQDIGFVGNELDTASLLSFVGSGNGFVRTWYDQIGNGLNVSQITTTQQPIIVSAGILETFNSRPSVRYSAANFNFLDGGNILSAGSNPLVTFAVGVMPNNQAIYAKSVYATGTGRYALICEGNVTYSLLQSTGGSVSATVGQAFSGQRLFNQEYVGAGNLLIVNNAVVAQNTTFFASAIGDRTTRFLIGAYPNSTDTGQLYYNNSHIQEVIIYLSNVSANRADINSSINSYYSIY
jgi:hypothetical protein